MEHQWHLVTVPRRSPRMGVSTESHSADWARAHSTALLLVVAANLL